MSSAAGLDFFSSGALVGPEYAPGWLALAADPAPLLGLPPVPRERDDDLLHRRDASFAAVQEHYYRSY